MKIGILQAGHAPDAIQAEYGNYGGLFERMLDGYGFEFTIYSVVDGAFPAAADSEDGWVITGSRHGAYEDHDWIAPLENLVREIHAARQPLAGICFGHQIIAQALGGTVEKFHGGWSVGAVEYHFDGVPLPAQSRVMAWHQDQVTKLPPEARVVGSNDFCANAALSYGDHIFSLQPHPEFSHDFIGGLLATRGQVLPTKVLETAQQGLDQPIDSNAVASYIAELMLRNQRG